jgi:hypothetical protein
LSGQKNAYFANSLNTSHRRRFALASIRKATPRPAFDGGRRKAKRQGTVVGVISLRNLCRAWGELEKSKRVHSSFRGKSLSSVFTQTRLFWPGGVKILFLMLTYMSTLRSKAGFFLVRPEKCVFCKFAQHQHRPRFALASLRKPTPRPAFDHSS